MNALLMIMPYNAYIYVACALHLLKRIGKRRTAETQKRYANGTSPSQGWSQRHERMGRHSAEGKEDRGETGAAG
jgi:hypothetical protein